MDELEALLAERGFGDHRIAALLLKGPDGATAILPLKTVAAMPRPLRPSLPKSLNFSDWCKYRGFSDALGYQLLAEGRGPRTMIVGKRNRIVTPEADAEWCAQQDSAAGVP